MKHQGEGGHPFAHHLVIDMPRPMDVEVAFPVDELPRVKGSISRGTECLMSVEGAQDEWKTQVAIKTRGGLPAPV